MRSKPIKRKVVTLTLRDDVLEFLRAIAYEEGLPLNVVIEKIVAKYMECTEVSKSRL
jgi:hypothetical protein